MTVGKRRWRHIFYAWVQDISLSLYTPFPSPSKTLNKNPTLNPDTIPFVVKVYFMEVAKETGDSTPGGLLGKMKDKIEKHEIMLQ